MPIRPEMRWYYPIDWPVLSAAIRFGRANGRCERCGRPHGQAIRQLHDGRWFDEAATAWRGDDGAPALWPDIEAYATIQMKTYHLSAAHIDHDPTNSAWSNLKALCQRCHLQHDRANNQANRYWRYRARFALGDFWAGDYAKLTGHQAHLTR